MRRLIPCLMVLVALGVAAGRLGAASGQSTTTSVPSASATVHPGQTTVLVNAPTGQSVELTSRADLAVRVTLDSALRILVPPGLAVDAVESTNLARVRCPDAPGSRDGCFNLNGPARIVFRLVVPSTPVPVLPRATVARGETATIPPGQSVDFLRPNLRAAMPSPSSTIGVGVSNESAYAATGVDDGMRIVLTLPPGVTARADLTYEGIYAATRPCPTEPRAPNVAVCMGILQQRATGARIRLTASATRPATETIALPRGCTLVALSWPEQTPLDLIARAVEPHGSLSGIWSYLPEWVRFLVFAPDQPEEVNDYFVLRVPSEVATVCLVRPGQITLPLP